MKFIWYQVTSLDGKKNGKEKCSWHIDIYIHTYITRVQSYLMQKIRDHGARAIRDQGEGTNICERSNPWKNVDEGAGTPIYTAYVITLTCWFVCPVDGRSEHSTRFHSHTHNVMGFLSIISRLITKCIFAILHVCMKNTKQEIPEIQINTVHVFVDIYITNDGIVE